MATRAEKKTKDIREEQRITRRVSRTYLDDVAKLKPLGDVVILKDTGGYVEQEIDGIILPSSSSHPVQIGEVVKASNGWFEKDKKGRKKFFDISLKRGDKVLFFYFGAIKLRTEKGNFLISKMHDIVGTVHE